MHAVPQRHAPSWIEKCFSIAMLFLLIVGVNPFIGFFAPKHAEILYFDPESVAYFSALYGAFFVTTLIISRGRISRLWFQNVSFLSLFALALLSCLWSPMAGNSALYALFLIGLAIMASFYAVRYSPEQMVELLAWAFLLVAAASLLAVVVKPSFAVMSGIHEGRWRGVFQHKNILGRFMSLGFLCCFLAAQVTPHKRQKYLFTTGALFCGFLVLQSQSASALLVALLTLFIAAIVRVCCPPQATQHRIFISLLAMFMGGMITLAVLPLLTETLFAFLGRDADLTGRTIIWSGAWQGILEHPLLGYGMDVFFNPDFTFAYHYIGLMMQWDAPHAHNGLIELTLCLGFIGAALLLLSLLKVSRRIFALLRSTTQHQAGQIFLVMTLYTIFTNISEVTVMRVNNALWFGFIYVVLKSGEVYKTSRLGQS